MQKDQFILLLAKYREGRATAEEARFVEAWYQSFELEEDVLGMLTDAERARLKEKIRLELMEKIRPGVVKRMLPRWMKIAAAAVVLFAVVTTYLLVSKQAEAPAAIAANSVKAPATNRATITLADGKTVYLDSAVNGQIAMQSGVELTKLGDGKIAYSGSTKELQYNTLTNPKGSRAINMVLPDGSQIWLDAGSSVTYPIAFVGNERRIMMNGELYYEVAHDVRKPFIVQKGEMTVQVYGTHFNVKAYDNEPDMKVTLLEGSVSVAQKEKRRMLKPGQQAVIAEAHIALIEEADTEEAVAWKNGKTSFHSADLQTVLREVERWYDINIEIKGAVPEKSFYADVSRNAPLSDVLKVLDDNNVKYLFDGKTRKLTIMQ